MARPVYIKKATIGIGDREEEVGLCINMHAMAMLQDKYGNNFDLGAALRNQTLTEIGDLVRIFLEGWRMRVCPERQAFTINDAFDVVDNMGGITELAAALVDLMDNSVSPEARRIAEERVRIAMEQGGPENTGADPTKPTKIGTPSKRPQSRPA
jgi:hypothetical protein